MTTTTWSVAARERTDDRRGGHYARRVVMVRAAPDLVDLWKGYHVRRQTDLAAPFAAALRADNSDGKSALACLFLSRAPLSRAQWGRGARRWRVENSGGYGEADTRVFGAKPEPKKVAASLVEVATKRAAVLAQREQRNRDELERMRRDESAEERAKELLGSEATRALVGGRGDGRVRLLLAGKDLICWPDEAPEALAALQRWHEDALRFGSPKKGAGDAS